MALTVTTPFAISGANKYPWTSNPLTDSTFSWSELIASTNENWAGFYIVIGSMGREAVIHFAKGLVGEEKTFVMLATNSPLNGGTSQREEYIPIPIPAGTRLSYDTQSWTTAAADIMLVGIPASNVSAVPRYVEQHAGPFDYDQSGNTTNWYVYAPLATTDNVKTAWTEISYTGTNSLAWNRLNGNSLAYRYKVLKFHFTTSYFGASSPVMDLKIDVAYGASGSEVPFISDLIWQKNPNDGLSFAIPISIPWNRPPGDRISFRYSCSNVATHNAVGCHMSGLL